jgi:F-type H+-transporting ATPase subunit a
MSASEAMIAKGMEAAVAATGTVHAAAGAAVEKAAEGGHHSAIPELQNLVDYIYAFLYKGPAHAYKGPESVLFQLPFKPEKMWEFTLGDLSNCVFSYIIIISLILIFWRLSKRLKRVPTGGQALVEIIVGAVGGFIKGIIGEESGKPFVPFLGTIFIFILCMNLSGLIPLYKSPIALNINVPLSMALCVFLFVQFHGLKQNGIKGYLMHFRGEISGILPLDCVLVPLNIILHVIGELVKPVSLTLRLFGNITGEDVVIAVLATLLVGGSIFTAWIPVQLVFYPLALMFSIMQALVFTGLSSAYILLMSKHEEEQH